MATNPRTTQTKGGFGLDHLTRLRLPMLAAPSTESQVNTLREPLVPVACWAIGDVRFDFGSSFPREQMAKETALLATLMARHAVGGQPPPITIFGHTDPTGSDDFNKQLSGRRAAAIYGLLTRDVGLWDNLFDNPLGEDLWGQPILRKMLRALGHEGTSAVREFQDSSGLVPSGTANPPTRRALFLAYMDAVCIDGTGAPFRVEKTGFLVGGRDAGGKGDYQGCGELNPVVLLSALDRTTLLKEKRDELNTPNRRILAFLFQPGTVVSAERWPCPRVSEDSTGCQARLFSDGKARRTPGTEQREYRNTKDTFACRFYDRFSRRSPCEGLLHKRIVEIVFDDAFFGFREGVAVKLAFADGSTDELTTDHQGAVFVEASRGPFADASYAAERSVVSQRVFLDPPDPSTDAGAWQRLANLGYVRMSGLPPVTPPSPAALAAAVTEFQVSQRILATGSRDADTLKELIQTHDTDDSPWRERSRFEGPDSPDPGSPLPKGKT